MKLVELVFREVNVVLVHTGIIIPAISLDRIRMARPSSNIQVTSSPGMIGIVYPDERIAVQLDAQRISASDTAVRAPEESVVAEVALAQHAATGGPAGVAFGYNVRFDFRVEGIDRPGVRLMEGTLRNPGAMAEALRTDTFQLGMKMIYRRGVKLWTFLMEPVLAAPERLLVHANVHEDLKAPEPVDENGPPEPPWLQEGHLEGANAGFPGAESLKADLSLQTRSAIETVAALLTLR